MRIRLAEVNHRKLACIVQASQTSDKTEARSRPEESAEQRAERKQRERLEKAESRAV